MDNTEDELLYKKHSPFFCEVHNLLERNKSEIFDCNRLLKQTISIITSIESNQFWNYLYSIDWNKSIENENIRFIKSLDKIKNYRNIGSLCYKLNIDYIPLKNNQINSIELQIYLYKSSGESNLDYDDLDDHEWTYVATIENVYKPSIFKEIINLNNSTHDLYKQRLLLSAFWDSLTYSIVKKFYQLNNINDEYSVIAGVSSVYRII